MKRIQNKSRKAGNKKAKAAIGTKPKQSVVDNKEDLKKLVHLFQVNLVELEHQNQELRITEEELEASRNKYVNLFDFAPIPYFALDPDGIIKEVNLSGAKMLGLDRNKLIDRNIIAYIPSEEKSVFNSFLKTVFTSALRQSCKVRVISKDKRVFHVLLKGLKSDEALESEQRCQIAIIDLTEYVQLEDSLKKVSEELALLKTGKNRFTS